MDIKATEDASNIVVTETIPKGTLFVSSDPEVNQCGEQITFTIDRLGKGQCKAVTLVFKPTCTGEICGCTTVTAAQTACAPICVVQACLECHKPDQLESIAMISLNTWSQ